MITRLTLRYTHITAARLTVIAAGHATVIFTVLTAPTIIYACIVGTALAVPAAGLATAIFAVLTARTFPYTASRLTMFTLFAF